VHRKRIATLALTSALTLAGALVMTPAASADVGDVLVQQMDASGQTVCTQDYVVANLTAPETITDQTCPDATTAKITNDTLEPINITNGPSDPEVPELEIIIITLTLTFNVEIPPGV
jgi:hypothetical protein